jgi:UDP-N-acetylglucosamine acyltransferase
MKDIHSTAIIHPEAELEDDIRVGPYSIISAGVRIGKGTEVGSHVVIEGSTKIGSNNRFFSFGSIGQIPQDLKFHGERTELVIGNNNVFRESVTIHRGTQGGGGKTIIGNDNFFMVAAHVAHDCKIADFVIMANAATLAGHVTIEERATVGAFSGIHQHCRVGKHAFIGGYSVITKDVLPFSKTVGNRAHCYGTNPVGLRRRGFSPETLAVIKQAFRLLLQSKLNTSQAIEAMERDVPHNPEIVYLIDFIRSSKRGIIK